MANIATLDLVGGGDGGLVCAKVALALHDDDDAVAW